VTTCEPGTGVRYVCLADRRESSQGQASCVERDGVHSQTIQLREDPDKGSFSYPPPASEPDGRSLFPRAFEQFQPEMPVYHMQLDFHVVAPNANGVCPRLLIGGLSSRLRPGDDPESSLLLWRTGDEPGRQHSEPAETGDDAKGGENGEYRNGSSQQDRCARTHDGRQHVLSRRQPAVSDVFAAALWSAGIASCASTGTLWQSVRTPIQFLMPEARN
jgi:hypothetical protein